MATAKLKTPSKCIYHIYNKLYSVYYYVSSYAQNLFCEITNSKIGNNKLVYMVTVIFIKTIKLQTHTRSLV